MTKYEKHAEICKKLNKIYIDKNVAYGDSFGKTFSDLGIMSAITRMNDKFNRVVALAKGAINNVKDEAIEDTLIDLANYSIMTLIEIENQNGSLAEKINQQKMTIDNESVGEYKDAEVYCHICGKPVSECSR